MEKIHINSKLSVTAKAGVFSSPWDTSLEEKKKGETSSKESKCFSAQELLFGEKVTSIIQMSVLYICITTFLCL